MHLEAPNLNLIPSPHQVTTVVRLFYYEVAAHDSRTVHQPFRKNFRIYVTEKYQTKISIIFH